MIVRLTKLSLPGARAEIGNFIFIFSDSKTTISTVEFNIHFLP
jgi:hypothetical protein